MFSSDTSRRFTIVSLGTRFNSRSVVELLTELLIDAAVDVDVDIDIHVEVGLNVVLEVEVFCTGFERLLDLFTEEKRDCALHLLEGGVVAAGGIGYIDALISVGLRVLVESIDELTSMCLEPIEASIDGLI